MSSSAFALIGDTFQARIGIGFVFIYYSVTATRKGFSCAKNYYSTSIDDTVEPICNSYKPRKRETIEMAADRENFLNRVRNSQKQR